MSRINAVEDLLYYPTDQEVTRTLIEKHIKPYPLSNCTVHAIDPCVGEGLALHTAVQALKAKEVPIDPAYAQYAWARYTHDHWEQMKQNICTYGVELDAVRAEGAKQLLGQVTNAAFENVRVSGKFQFVWMNPPYDQIKGTRVELRWMRMALPLLSERGMMIAILPEYFIEGGSYGRALASILSKHNVRTDAVLKFPEPEFSKWRQYAFILSKTNGYGMHVDLTPRGVIGECDVVCTWSIDSVNNLPMIEVVSDKEITSVLENGIPAQLADVLGPASAASSMRPLKAMYEEHAGMLAAAGAFNGVRVGSSVLRGRTIKKTTTAVNNRTSDTGGSAVTEVLKVESFAAELSVFDLDTGKMQVLNSADDKEEFENLLLEHASEFIDLTKKMYPAKFKPEYVERYRRDLERVRSPRRVEGMRDGLLPPQMENAAAILFGWKSERTIIFVGEMATGKTVTSAAAAVVAASRRKEGNNKVVVLMPAKDDLIEKWGKEVKTACREFGVWSAAPTTPKEVDAAFRKKGVGFILLKETTAKQSSGWRAVDPIVVERINPKSRVKETRQLCPVCGKPLRYVKFERDKDEEKEKDIDEDKLPDPSVYKTHCEACDAPMWQLVAQSNGKPAQPLSSFKEWAKRVSALPIDNTYVTEYIVKERMRPWRPKQGKVPLAEYISQRYGQRYILIIDECFPGDTLIATDKGEIPIKDIRPGDMVLSEKDGQKVYRRVSKVMRKPKLKRTVRITHDLGTLTCTEDHKIYTDHGMVKACELDNSVQLRVACKCDTMVTSVAFSGDKCSDAKTIAPASDLSCVQARVQQQRQAATNLLLEKLCSQDTRRREACIAQEQGKNQVQPWHLLKMRAQLSERLSQSRQHLLLQVMLRGGQVGVGQDGSRQQGQNAGADRVVEGGGAAQQREPCYKSEDGCNAQQAQVHSTWRQRTLDRVASSVGKRARRRLGDGILHRNWQSEVEKGAGGYCASDHQDCRGSAWQQPPQQQTAQPRRDEEGHAGSPWLASDCRLELAGTEGCTGLSQVHSVEYVDIPDEYVYDLTVEDTHRYFAAGVLVSNCHHYKSADSDRGAASMDLLAGSHRAILMTGTIYNGMASSIFALLFRAIPSFRAQWAWGSTQEFVNTYGLQEKLERTYTGTQTSSSGYNKLSQRVTERPGVAPSMIQLLLPVTVFFKMSEMQIVMPPYSEHTLFVDTDEELAPVFDELDKIKAEAIARYADRDDPDPSLLGQFTQLKYGVWDVIAEGDAVDDFTIDAIEPKSKHGMFAKEEAFVRYVYGEKLAGRKCLVYLSQIERRPCYARLIRLLDKYGIKATVMKADVKGRVEFINRAIKQGADVILTSAQLVKEGVDLLTCPTILWYGTESRAYDVPQANRRSWRPGQTRPCKVIYMGYNGTPQADASHRLAKKLAGAQALSGDIRSGLAQLFGDDDFMAAFQSATISRKSFESDIALADLPALPPVVKKPTHTKPQAGGTADRQVDVDVHVTSTTAARVRVTVDVDTSSLEQLSLF